MNFQRQAGARVGRKVRRGRRVDLDIPGDELQPARRPQVQRELRRVQPVRHEARLLLDGRHHRHLGRRRKLG